jgi:hypothetical protein
MEAGMLDGLSVVALAALFVLAVSYVQGCERLKGSR